MVYIFPIVNIFAKVYISLIINLNMGRAFSHRATLVHIK